MTYSSPPESFSPAISLSSLPSRMKIDRITSALSFAAAGCAAGFADSRFSAASTVFDRAASFA